MVQSRSSARRRKTVAANTSENSAGTSIFPLVLFDYYSALSMVFGGCCVNVFAYEQLLLMNPTMGSALTFSQMLFITLQSLPSFLYWPLPPSSSSSSSSSLSSFWNWRWLPKLKPRKIPLKEWIFQVLVMSSASLLNNWVYAFKVPMTLMIVFRSAGLAVSMVLGATVLGKTYTKRQMLSVLLVTFGVVITTVYRPSSSNSSSSSTTTDPTRYPIGIAMMTASLFLSGIHGLLQERTYTKYGPHWREGVFYNHALSLPVFLFLGSDVKQGLQSLGSNSYVPSAAQSYLILALNLLSQLVCVSGVNKLSSQTSSVSTNLVLTIRKAISLLFSIWWFGNGWNVHLVFGASLVFIGGILFSATSSPTVKSSTISKNHQRTEKVVKRTKGKVQ